MLINTLSDFQRVMEWIPQQDRIAFDTETTGLNPYGSDRICGVALYNRGQHFYLPFRHGLGVNLPVSYLKPLLIELIQCRAPLITWNGKFDMHMGFQDGMPMPPNGKIRDAMLAAHLCDENEDTFGLKPLSDKYLSDTSSKDEDELKDLVEGRYRSEIAQIRKRMSTNAAKIGQVWKGLMWKLYAEEVADYAESDVRLTMGMEDFYAPHLAAWGLTTMYTEVCDYLLLITRMERRGCKIDLEFIHNEIREAGPKMAEAQEEIGIWAGNPAINPGSPTQLAQSFNWWVVKPDGKRGTNTNKEFLDDLVESYDEKTKNGAVARAVLAYRDYSKQQSSYYQRYLEMADATQTLRPSYNLIGTYTGRLSCIAQGSLVDAPRDLLKFPKGIPIEQVEVGQQVYSFDHDGVPRPRRVLAKLEQGRKRVLKLVWSTLAGGGHISKIESMKLTPDHRVRLATGEYRRVDQLKPGDQLSYMSRTINQNGRYQHHGKEGGFYAFLRWNGYGSGPSIEEHRHLLGLITGDGIDCHHKDDNKLNNALDNLQTLTKAEHAAMRGGKPRPEQYKSLPGSDLEFEYWISTEGMKSTARRLGWSLDAVRDRCKREGIIPPHFSEINSSPLPERSKLDEALAVSNAHTARIFNVHINVARRWKKFRVAELALPVNHQVIAVIDEGEQLPTWDLTIEDTPNFVVSGLVMHNCFNPNLQAVPRSSDTNHVKSAFIAREGYQLAEGDFNQAELRVFSHYAQEHTLGRLLMDRADLHSRTAARLNIPRWMAKRINFSVVYGVGAQKLSINLGVPLDEAKKALADYHAEYSGFKRLYRQMTNVADTHGYIRLDSGRVRRYNRGQQTPTHKASSNLIQGTVAEVMRVAMQRIDRELGGTDELHMLLQVHDSLMFEIKEGQAERYLPEIQRIMCEFPFTYPMEVDFKVGNRWGTLKGWESKAKVGV